jgi:acyl-CoA hydrolase
MPAPSVSRTEMTEMILPSDTNNLGTVFGGKLMQWIDLCAAMAAQRHSHLTVVTAAVDELHFLTPIKAGMIVVLQAQVNAVFRSSMEVGVRVESEAPWSGERRKCVKAYLTFVALDETGRTIPLPALEPQTEVEKRRERDAHDRRALRLRVRAGVKDAASR